MMELFAKTVSNFNFKSITFHRRRPILDARFVCNVVLQVYRTQFLNLIRDISLTASKDDIILIKYKLVNCLNISQPLRQL